MAVPKLFSNMNWSSIPSFLNSNDSLRMKLRKLLLKSPNKYCELDPIPTNLLKECIDEILPLITKIINLSLQLGNMPTSLKNAIIKPMLNKLCLELINKKYIPVSNLPFLSKLIDREVALQLVDHKRKWRKISWNVSVC